MSTISFPVMPLWPGTLVLRILFPLLRRTFFLVFGFLSFLCHRLWQSMCLTSQLRLPFFVRFSCSPYGFYYGFLFGAVCILYFNILFFFLFCSSICSGAISLYLRTLYVLCIFRRRPVIHKFSSGIIRCLIRLVLFFLSLITFII
jgi:hypothetical protein